MHVEILDAQRTVEQLLSVQFGTSVRIACVKDFPHSQVSRCTLEAASPAVPRTVIVRVLRDGPARSGPARLHNEHAALVFLTSIGSTLAPRFIAADAAAGILVTEDLGTHPSLLDLLLGDDREAAHQGLIAFAESLGTVHAQTVGYASAYDDVRARVGPADPNAAHPGIPFSLGESWRRVRDAVAELGLPEPWSVDGDIDEVARILSASDACLALSNGDPSFVNCAVTNPTVRFFDFEDAGFRHALIDAVVLKYPYPTGGPSWRVPSEVAESMEFAYREVIGGAYPVVLDNDAYERGMAAASAAWTILRMGRLARVEAGPDRDPWLLVPPGWPAPIPMRSRRRQLVAIIETCVNTLHGAGTLEALTGWLERIVAVLRARWPEATEDIPLYPAFQCS